MPDEGEGAVPQPTGYELGAAEPTSATLGVDALAVEQASTELQAKPEVAPDEAGDAAHPPTQLHVVQIRRAPKLRTFVVLGILLGALVGTIVGFGFPESESLSRAQAAGWVLLISVPLFVVLSLAIYLAIDRRSRKRASAAEATLSVEQPDNVVGSSTGQQPEPQQGTDEG